MAVAQHLPTVSAPSAAPVRKITSEDLSISLRDGWQDFMAMRGDLIFIGLLYPLVGLVAATVTLGGTLLPLFFPIAAGISLLGPIVAIGFYELARRREDGLESDWSHFFDVRKRPSADGLGVVAALLVTIFMLWVAAAAILYVALWGMNAPDSIGACLMMRWGMIVAVLLVLGSIPAFIGLAVVLPWLGYATWHLYTRLVDRAAFPHCAD